MMIEWTDKDPETGAKRSVRAEKFARKWTFRVQFRRYTNWEPVPRPSRDMWEELLDALERRLPRREGVTEEDVKQVRAALEAVETISPQRHKAITKGHKEDGGKGENEESSSPP